MRFHPLHCWDCGTRIIEGTRGAYNALPSLRLVRFHLTGNAYCESPFCVACAGRAWTPGRLRAFEEAVNQTSPIRVPIGVEACVGVRTLITTVLDA